MSVGKELWGAVRSALIADTDVMADLNGIYDKSLPADPWGTKQSYMTRGPLVGSQEDADCIIGQEVTLQLDIWSRDPNRWSTDDIISAVRKRLHNQEVALTENALVSLEVTLWRVLDDPDGKTIHGVVQLTARVEEPEDA